MKITATHALEFRNEKGERFVTDPRAGTHEAPNWITRDPFFMMNRDAGRIIVLDTRIPMNAGDMLPPAPTRARRGRPKKAEATG